MAKVKCDTYYTNDATGGIDLYSISELSSDELAELSQYLKVKKLSQDLKMSQYMLFSPKTYIGEKTRTKFNNQCISENKSSKKTNFL